VTRADAPLLVVVTGPPATGKTGVGRDLAERLGLPVVSKDDLKETLYDVLGQGDELEEALERAALALAFRVAGAQLAAGVPVLIESDFDSGSDLAPLRRLVAEHGARLVQVHIGGDPATIVRRFVERAERGDRHPGHGDDAGDADELRDLLESGRWDPLELDGELYTFDLDERDEIVGRVAARLT
jgi:predicted kinase